MAGARANVGIKVQVSDMARGRGRTSFQEPNNAVALSHSLCKTTFFGLHCWILVQTSDTTQRLKNS